MLLTHPDPAKLDAAAGVLRAAGMRVVALNRLDAVVPLTRVFKPDLALLALGPGPLEVAKVGRRVSRRFRGAVPVLYLGDVADADGREHLLSRGLGLEVVPERAPPGELLARLERILALRFAVADAERSALEERSPTLHDEITGLYNRRFLLEMVTCELRRVERHGGAFTVLIGELEDFAKVHERHGDEVCDRLMVLCATHLRQGLREADLVARVGKYHFGALLHGMGPEQLGPVRARLERRLLLARFDLEGRPVRASMTFGAASFPDVTGPAQQIFAQAIQDLDRARDDRRGQDPRAAV